MPATALGVVDPNSLSDDAEIVATAADGGGGSEDRDRAGRIGFSEFTATVRARDRNSDSGRSGKADAFQDTKVVESESALFGVDSQGTGSASFTNPQLNDGAEPVGSAHSELTVDFEVVGDPVLFSLTGNMSGAATPGSGGFGGAVTVVSPSGTNHDANSGDSVAIEETGELAPGTHSLTVELDAQAFNDGISSASSTASYDIKLRFCTITMPPSLLVVGTSGDDVICGSPDQDLINGAEGKDRIFGLGGNDEILGGPGADVIEGGDGDDIQLYGGPGNDFIDAGRRQRRSSGAELRRRCGRRSRRRRPDRRSGRRQAGRPMP